MKDQSRFDELHDKYYSLLSTKAGTRYERLAAAVFKLLHDQDIVIHDLKVTGDSDVKHQIDVTIERDGEEHQILIECKDFDISGDKVGLGIVRDFYGVVADTKPDEVFVVSCNGFTRDARKYAKSMGIKLLVLRKFEEEDWDGRIREIKMNLHACFMVNPELGLAFPSDEASARYNAALEIAGLRMTGIAGDAPVQFYDGGNAFNSVELIEDTTKDKVMGDTEEVVKVPRRFIDGKVIVEDQEPIEIDGVVVSFLRGVENRHFSVGADSIATLILQGFGAGDIVFFEHELQRCMIDESTGEVTLNQ